MPRLQVIRPMVRQVIQESHSGVKQALDRIMFFSKGHMKACLGFSKQEGMSG